MPQLYYLSRADSSGRRHFHVDQRRVLSYTITYAKERPAGIQWKNNYYYCCYCYCAKIILGHIWFTPCPPSDKKHKRRHDLSLSQLSRPWMFGIHIRRREWPDHIVRTLPQLWIGGYTNEKLPNSSLMGNSCLIRLLVWPRTRYALVNTQSKNCRNPVAHITQRLKWCISNKPLIRNCYETWP